MGNDDVVARFARSLIGSIIATIVLFISSLLFEHITFEFVFLVMLLFLLIDSVTLFVRLSRNNGF